MLILNVSGFHLHLYFESLGNLIEVCVEEWTCMYFALTSPNRRRGRVVCVSIKLLDFLLSLCFPIVLQE